MTVTITKQINILNRSITVAATGVIAEQCFPDIDRYSGTLSWYFEIVAKVTSGTGTVVLEETDGTDKASISVTQTSVTRIRQAFSGTPGGVNGFQMNVTAIGTGFIIYAARIVIIQSDATAITKTETHIELGDYSINLTNTASYPIGYTKYWYYDSANYDGTVTFEVEAVYISSSTKGNVTIKLQESGVGDFTFADLVTVVNAQHATAATRVRVSFTPTSSGRNYRLVSYCSTTKYNYTVYCGKVIVVQSDATAITKTEYVASILPVAWARTGLLDREIGYDSGTAEWEGVTKTFYHEMDVNTTGTNITTKLQSDPNGTPADIPNSQIATSAGPLRIRSSALTMPTGTPIEIDGYGVTFSAGYCNHTKLIGVIVVSTGPPPQSLSAAMSFASGQLRFPQISRTAGFQPVGIPFRKIFPSTKTALFSMTGVLTVSKMFFKTLVAALASAAKLVKSNQVLLSRIIVDSLTEDNSNDTIPLDNSRTAVGQSFTGNGRPVTQIVFYGKKINSPGGTAVARLYAHTGTFGGGGVPTGSPLATSNTVNVATISDVSDQLIPFTFPTPYTPSNGVKYVSVLEYTNGTATDYLAIRQNVAGDTNPIHAGNLCSYISPTWSGFTWNDLIFYVKTQGISMSFAGIQASFPKIVKAATFTSTGTKTSKFARGFTAGLSYLASIKKNGWKTLSGSLQSLANLATQKYSGLFQVCSATLSFIGTVPKKTLLSSFSSGFGFIGDVLRPRLKSFSAAITWTGRSVKNTFKSFSSSLISSSIVEEFIGVDADPPDPNNWTVISGTPQINSNRLRVKAENDDNVRSGFYFTGDFDVRITFDISEAPKVTSGQGNWYLYFGAYRDDTHRVHAEISYTWNSGRVWNIKEIDGGGWTGGAGQFYYDDITQVRLVRVGHTFQAYILRQSTQEWLTAYPLFTNVGSDGDPFYLYVYADNSTPFPNATFYLDNLAVESGALINFTKRKKVAKKVWKPFIGTNLGLAGVIAKKTSRIAQAIFSFIADVATQFHSGVQQLYHDCIAAMSFTAGVVKRSPRAFTALLNWSVGSENNFSDSRCISLYRFESGALAVDSKGTNTLNLGAGDAAPTEDTANFWEGSCSARFDSSKFQYFYIWNNNLTSNFPLKAGDTDKKATFCFWYKPVSQPAGDKGIIAKWEAGNLCFVLDHNGSRLDFGWATSTSNADWNWIDIVTLVTGQEYHIGLVIDGVAKTARLRIWDKTAQTATTYSHTYAIALNLSLAQFSLGGINSAYTNSNMDECAVFNDTLSDDEIDRVRQKTFGSSGIKLNRKPLKLISGALTHTATAGTKALKVFSGTMAPIGTFIRKTTKLISGVIQPAGIVDRLRGRILTAVLNASGTISKTVVKPLSATLATVASEIYQKLGVSLVYLQASLGLAGDMIKKSSHSFIASINPTGAIVKYTPRAYAATTSFVGATVKKSFRAITAGVNFIASITKLGKRSLTAGMNLIGNVFKRTPRAFVGQVTFIGMATKKFSRAISAAIQFGAIACKKAITSAKGALSFIGAVLPKGLFARTIQAAVTFSASVRGKALKVFSATLSPSGVVSILSAFKKSMVATFTMIGAVTKKSTHAFSGVLTSTALVTGKATKSLSGAVSSAGSILRLTGKKVAGVLSPAGVLATLRGRILTAVLNASGEIVKGIKKPLTRVFSTIGAIIYQVSGMVFKALDATMTFTAIATKKTSRALSSTFSFVAIACKKLWRILKAVLLNDYEEF